MDQPKQWDVLSLVKVTTEHFQQKYIDEARLHVEYMLAHVMHLNRMELYLNFDRPVSPSELEQFRLLCKRKLKGEPLQYILGTQDFFGLTFKTDHRGLIPRSETEMLVEFVLDEIHKKNLVSPSILDIGTGSGCIAISMAYKLQNSRVVAVDVSTEAIELAKENAVDLGFSEKVEFICLDALNNEFNQSFSEGFDVIISNPPYIPLHEKEELQVEVRDFEPDVALFVNEGSEFYRKITHDANVMLNPGGILAFEMHSEGKETIEAILIEHNFTDLRFEKDLSGFYRVAIANKTKTPKE